MEIRYSSNNSGGRWWLTDDHWRALEAAGWTVRWIKDDPFYASYRVKDGRWLGALAEEASKDFASPADAIREWEHITGRSASDEGCNCCGAPHSFSWEGGYASGEDVVRVLYPVAPSSLREAMERGR